MLLKGYRITEILPCIVNPEWIRMKTGLSDDVGEVLPYLNAQLKNATYNAKTQSLTFRFKEGQMFVTIFPSAINLAQVPTKEDGERALNELQELINETWKRRNTITPLYEKSELKAREVLDLLPNTNCRECGLPTCFAFAMAIVKGQKHPKDCPPLNKLEFAEEKDALLTLLQNVGLEE